VERASRRELRLTFDEIAQSYDRTRPVLPDVVFDDLIEAAALVPGSRVLEVGCGTGQATVPLAKRDLAITAIELGPQLAALARTRVADYPLVEVVASSFEAWEHNGEPFDVVVAVNSLHWIDPDLRYDKPVSILRPGGAMVVAGCWWAAPAPPEEFFVAVQDDYDAVAYPGGPPPPADLIGPWHFPLQATGLLSETVARRYIFDVRIGAEEYVANLATQSTTRQLGSEVVEEFLWRVRRRLGAMGRDQVDLALVALLTVGTTPN